MLLTLAIMGTKFTACSMDHLALEMTIKCVVMDFITWCHTTLPEKRLTTLSIIPLGKVHIIGAVETVVVAVISVSYTIISLI